ncbi:hypothetical protein BH20ACT13_BH20ACT13_17730 [soil metagenome]
MKAPMEPRFRLGMRWWLALVFAVITAVTAVAVAELLVWRAEQAFRERSVQSALRYVLATADTVSTALDERGPGSAVDEVAHRRRLSVFLFDGSGAPVGSMSSNGRQLMSVPDATRAVASALAGGRFARSYDEGRTSIVAVPLRSSEASVLLAFAPQPGYGDTMAVFKDQVRLAVVIATAIGAAIGFIVASLLAARLKRIGVAASAIERGEFAAAPLRVRFGDEIGTLAQMIERMRVRLRTSIEHLDSERTRLERLLGRLDQGVVAIDAELRVEVANTAAARLLDVNSLGEGDELPIRGRRTSRSGTSRRSSSRPMHPSRSSASHPPRMRATPCAGFQRAGSRPRCSSSPTSQSSSGASTPSRPSSPTQPTSCAPP